MAYINGFGNMVDGSPPYYDDSNGQDMFQYKEPDRTWRVPEEPEPTWRMRGGREIRIRDMDDKHLLNTDRAIRARTAKADEFTASMIYGEIVRRGLQPLPDFSSHDEAEATACVSKLHTFYARLDDEERRRLMSRIVFMSNGSGDGDGVHVNPETDSFAFAQCHRAVCEFFELRRWSLEGDAQTRVDTAFETWMEKEVDGGR